MPCLNNGQSLSESFGLAPSVEFMVVHLIILYLIVISYLLGLLVSGGM
jgi:hypothetical protein